MKVSNVTALANVVLAIALVSTIGPNAAASPQHSTATVAGRVHALVPTSKTSKVFLPKDWRQKQLRMINKVRAAKGVNPLQLCEPINSAAQKYADLMARTGHFDHIGPKGSTWSDRMEREGYVGFVSAENIAVGPPTVRIVMNGWINSPGHYRNLVEPRLTHVGLGASKAKNGRRYWVQDFGVGGECSTSDNPSWRRGETKTFSDTRS